MNIVSVGVSTGGLRALTGLLEGLPRLNACIVIVIHTLKSVEDIIAGLLGQLTEMDLSIAKHGDLLTHGRIYIAPSGKHLKLIANRQIELCEGEKVNFVCPAADVMMTSLSSMPNDQLVGIVMTGLGQDAALGVQHIKGLGGMTIAQEPSTCAAPFMPRCAIASGAIDLMLSPQMINKKLSELFAPDVAINLADQQSDEQQLLKSEPF